MNNKEGCVIMQEAIVLTIETIRENDYNIEKLDLTIKNYLTLTEKKILIEKILDIFFSVSVR